MATLANLTSYFEPPMTVLRLLGLLITWYFIFLLLKAIRNIYFHPLSDIPGPKLWIAFPFLKFLSSLTGRIDEKVRHHHDTLGPTIRIAPNELSFTTAEAWHEIHGAHNPELPRHMSQFEAPALDIIRADAHEHARIRKALGHGFSDRALREQEPLIQHYITLLLTHFRTASQTSTPVNLTEWFTHFTFDLIGDLAYGRSFSSLTTGTTHSYTASLLRAIPARPVITGATDFPILAFLLKYTLMFTSAKRMRSEMLAFASTTIRARLADGSKQGRADFVDAMSRSASKDPALAMTEPELIANATIILAAGSETTATFLTGAIYYLLRHPRALRRATTEIRAAFRTEDAISISSTTAATLPWTTACLEEVFRLYPPVPASNPRRTVLPVTRIAGVHVPRDTAVGVHHSAAYWSGRNFVRAGEFRPERWLKDLEKKPGWWDEGADGDGEWIGEEFRGDKREVVQPFTVGRRDCIGRNLAWAEIRLVVVRMLWGFELGFGDEEAGRRWGERQRAFTLWIKGPLEVRFREREGERQRERERVEVGKKKV